MPSASPLTTPRHPRGHPRGHALAIGRRSVGDRFVTFLETGGATVPDGLFAPDAFADLSFPTWRGQVEGGSALAEARRHSRPGGHGAAGEGRAHPRRVGAQARGTLGGRR